MWGLLLLNVVWLDIKHTVINLEKKFAVLPIYGFDCVVNYVYILFRYGAVDGPVVLAIAMLAMSIIVIYHGRQVR